MFNVFKRIRAAVKPVVVVTGKIKYNERTNTYAFWPNYAKSNELKSWYDLGVFTKNPAKYHNITCIGVISIEDNQIINFSNGVDGVLLNIKK